MSALRLVTTPPNNLAEAVTTSVRLHVLRSLAGLTFQYDTFPKSLVQRSTPARVSLRMNALLEEMVTPPNSALDLSGTPGTGRFLF
jgi:hypothetical protein